jgi:hypothetical protein
MSSKPALRRYSREYFTQKKENNFKHERTENKKIQKGN